MFKKKYYNNKMAKPLIFNPHTTDNICMLSTVNFNEIFLQAAFIDPGTVSCALRIVRFYYKINRIKVIWFGILNFGNSVEDTITGVETALSPLLQKIIYCHYIVIEKQLTLNLNVYRTTQYVIHYISSSIKNKGFRGIIIEVDVQLKTVFIGGPKTAKQNGGISIKKWSKQKALDIIKRRNDKVSMAILENSKYKAKEDLCDTICYEYAWWLYFQTIPEIEKKII